jgi:DNA-binding IclR family transcriptional regulator
VRLTPAARIVLRELELFAAMSPEWLADPSVATLSAVCELDRRTVQRCLRRLEEAGWIEPRERWGDSTRYAVRNLQPVVHLRHSAAGGILTPYQ